MPNPVIALLKAHATPAEWRRLQYLARRIKSRTATNSEVAEYRLVVSVAAEASA